MREFFSLRCATGFEIREGLRKFKGGAGICAGDTDWQKFLNDAHTRVGLDILSVIGLASAVALLGMAGV